MPPSGLFVEKAYILFSERQGFRGLRNHLLGDACGPARGSMNLFLRPQS